MFWSKDATDYKTIINPLDYMNPSAYEPFDYDKWFDEIEAAYDNEKEPDND